jgi:hypothetical protein
MVKTNEAQLRLLVLPAESPEAVEVPYTRKREPREVGRREAGPRGERRAAAPRQMRMPAVEAHRKMAPALIAKHCNVLLAEIERVAPRETWDQRSIHSEARANHLAQLFAAAERANESQPEAQRAKVSA